MFLRLVNGYPGISVPFKHLIGNELTVAPPADSQYVHNVVFAPLNGFITLRLSSSE